MCNAFQKHVIGKLISRQYEALKKAVIAYDENNIIVCKYDSSIKAEIAEGISDSNIRACAKHMHAYAGTKNGNKLRWEYADSDIRIFYDHKYPRKSQKPYYYEKEDERFCFSTNIEAAMMTRGKFAVGTQQHAITKSIRSKGIIPCKSGYFWFKL